MRRSLTALAMAVSLGSAAVAAETGGAVPTPARQTDAMVEAASAAWFKGEWQRYVGRFVTPDGRVVDTANGGISHSEGQGYGLLLAAMAGDRGRFEALWRWTQAQLMVRKDGLAAWKWDPAAGTATDPNNATDGDILIAWALDEGARRFERPDYRRAAARLARAIGATLVTPSHEGPALLPGAKGFRAGEQPDGPVVNLSYWVFPAFPALKALAPETDWDGVRRSGLAILERSRFGARGLPTEWESIADESPRPAKNFPPVFGYNAIRIPLYLALEGSPESRAALRRFAADWTKDSSAGRAAGAGITVPLGEPGYDLVLALARCVAAGEVIPPALISTPGTLYYPETLRLLSVLAIQERFPACL